MPRARKHQISLEATPYYHCVSRCVCRAFLCGFDHFTQTSYEHRRQWVEDRILQLSEIFAIDVCAYAVMSNHLHVVLHINKARSLHWSNKEVCKRWHQLFKGTALSKKYLQNKPLTLAEVEAVEQKIEQWRLNLCDISWFMRTLNESIARQANAEDQCSGRFWEGRFKSQALLDEKALMACLAYVDLNPVRAKIATTPETSEHTSIKKRIQSARDGEQPSSLMTFVGNPREPMSQGLPFKLQDYIELLEWTGRIIRENKRGAIDADLPPILDRLDIGPKQWLRIATQFESRFARLAASSQRTLKNAAMSLGYQRRPREYVFT